MVGLGGPGGAAEENCFFLIEERLPSVVQPRLAEPEVGERLHEFDLAAAIKAHQATFLQIVGESYDLIRPLVEQSTVPTIVSTWRKETVQELNAWKPDLAVQELGHEVTTGINALLQVREVLLAAYVEGHFSSNDRVLVVGRLGDAFEIVVFIDMRFDESVSRLKKELEFRADVRVIEAVLQIASEIAREGRERGHVGALFVIGDSDRVMDISRQVVINPFLGHPESVRNILDPSTWETAKEFSQIDGAFVVRDHGLIEAAGRYIEVKQPVSLPSGLGGRHLAAAAVTKETKAIAIVVSETGVVRIFKDGEILLRIGTT